MLLILALVFYLKQPPDLPLIIYRGKRLNGKGKATDHHPIYLLFHDESKPKGKTSKMSLNDINSLSHTKWEYPNNMVFIPCKVQQTLILKDF